MTDSTKAPPNTIVWFRTELRTDDHPALSAASDRGAVAPVFIWDAHNTQNDPWKMGGACKWWLHHSLQSLHAELTDLGSPLIIRQGNPAQELIDLARQASADRVMTIGSLDPAQRERDEEIEHALNDAGIELEICPTDTLWEIGAVRTKEGRPYQVYSPFFKAGLGQLEVHQPIEAPAALIAPAESVRTLDIDELGLLPSIDWDGGFRKRWTPGSSSAHTIFDAFASSKINGYKEGRNWLDLRFADDGAGWSALSPHMKFGEISVRRMWHTLIDHADFKNRNSVSEYMKQLAWREFAQHLLTFFPDTPTEPLRDQFDAFPWNHDPAHFDAWKKGQTGYPVVDACMRHLYHEGWMPNRGRMIVASFLCKHLLIPWQDGANWFWDTLVDADLGNNTLGWQWTAGCGADAAPYFRIFNPITQGQKFDPDGSYVRTWVPEIAELNTKVIHSPWEAAPLELQAAGITLGEDYPLPIVDHKAARDTALAAYEKIKK
ncbi:MAG: deoxyribodipyrimidine photo-lyase [Phycisphaerales bacterium]